MAGILEWFARVGIQLERCIQIRQMPGDPDAIGVFSTQNIKEGDLLACIPKAAVLSTRNSTAAALLEASELRGGLALNFAVLFEQFVRGSDSKW